MALLLVYAEARPPSPSQEQWDELEKKVAELKNEFDLRKEEFRKLKEESLQIKADNAKERQERQKSHQRLEMKLDITAADLHRRLNAYEESQRKIEREVKQAIARAERERKTPFFVAVACILRNEGPKPKPGYRFEFKQEIPSPPPTIKQEGAHEQIQDYLPVAETPETAAIATR